MPKRYIDPMGDNEETGQIAMTATQQTAANPVDKMAGVKKFAFSMMPFVPVSFTGPDAIAAYTRLALYGTVAYVTFKKNRNISYIAMGAAGLSALTSMSSGMMK